MPVTQSSAPRLPPLAHHDSHTIRYIFPHPATPRRHDDDDYDYFFQGSQDPIPLTLVNKGKQGATNGNTIYQFEERRSSDTLRNEHRRFNVFRDDESEYGDTRQLYEPPSPDVEKDPPDGKDPSLIQPTIWPNDVVGWDGPNDPLNPQNWSKSKKYTVTVFYSSMTFCITFSSSVFSVATLITAKEYGVSAEVMTLGTSLFVFVSPSSPAFIRSSSTHTSHRVLGSAP